MDKSNDSSDCLLTRILRVMSMLSYVLHFVMVVHNKHFVVFATFALAIGELIL